MDRSARLVCGGSAYGTSTGSGGDVVVRAPSGTKKMEGTIDGSRTADGGTREPTTMNDKPARRRSRSHRLLRRHL